MQIGAIFPHQEIGSDPLVIRDWAQAAEELGYSHIIAYDHVLGANHDNREPPLWGPYTEHDAFHEPFVLFGYLAGCTKTIGLGTGILILPQRQTALVAKQAAEIDLLSNERLRLGIGVGWNYVEYDSLNESFADRGARQEEQVDVLRALWQEPLVTFKGKWHEVERAGLKPLPKRQIPIWFGGFADVAFKRAVRLGDGFMFGSSQEQNLAAFERVSELLAAASRERASFGIEAFLNYQSGQEHWRAEAEAWQARGADYVSMRAMALRGLGGGLDSPQAHIDALATYWSAVGDLSSP
ncbi:MAG: LLM class F420-dependent oxidoreductase [Pseudomonadaceae bacterium]|nr:LLM class F420-dependent oxidoreductase [Pseudomonadaceae bacterium]